MENIRQEEKFKVLLETLFSEYSKYDNLISFIEDQIESEESLNLAKDFAEDLSFYEEDIEGIFNLNIFDIDNDNLDICFEEKYLENISQALNQIRGLIPSDFERLCALFLKFLGTTGNPYITKHSHDQGIDFLGSVEKKERSKLFSAQSSVNKIYLFGQAKHYKEDKVKSKEIRELAGSVYLLKTKAFAQLDNPYPNLKIQSFTPIFVYFITSYYFSEPAKRLCKNSDIIPIDRISLAITFGLNSQFHDVDQKFNVNLFSEAIESIDFI